jgi:metallo-beta-lactamase class B
MKKLLLAAPALLLAGIGIAAAQNGSGSGSVESHVIAARRAAGGNFGGVLSALCPVDPAAQPPSGPGGRGAAPGRGAAGPRPVPDRATWYAKPYKVFDNLYFIGTKIHSAWALTTSQGIIVIDTLFDYAIEPEMVEGLKALKLDPAQVKYVLISHAHGDHDQGAALFQSRYGAKVVMGAADWDLTATRKDYAGGIAKKDISVGPEGTRITLGDTTVNVLLTPGHTQGTLSFIFPVKDQGKTLTVSYSGGTAFNFPRDVEHFNIYAATQRKMAEASAAAGATILMSNHTQWEGGYDNVRLAQLRDPGEAHPYDIGANAVKSYYTMTENCALAVAAQLARK